MERPQWRHAAEAGDTGMPQCDWHYYWPKTLRSLHADVLCCAIPAIHRYLSSILSLRDERYRYRQSHGIPR